MLHIVLVEPEHPGNIGFIARAMKNFGVKKLLLINPRCNFKNQEAISRAKHAKDVLSNARLVTWKELEGFDYVIGTTSKLGTDYNIPRSPITPEELAEKLSFAKAKVALVFGREGSGLNNEEILKCDFVVTIPSSVKYPTLNISHAVAIILYELFKKSRLPKTRKHISASAKEKRIILHKFDTILDHLPFATPDKKRTQQIVWKRLFSKSFMTKREAFAVIGLLNKLTEALKMAKKSLKP